MSTSDELAPKDEQIYAVAPLQEFLQEGGDEEELDPLEQEFMSEVARIELDKEVSLPPGSTKKVQTPFEEQYDKSYCIPWRLRGKGAYLVHTANAWHFGMMNDFDRNEFYREGLQAVVSPDKLVLEVGTGSGLLAMMAASMGAKQVVTIEVSPDFAKVATNVIASNGLSDRIKVVNSLSTDVTVEDHLGGQRADVLVSELLGTNLLGEGALGYVADARRRLLKPDGIIIPAFGTQFATLIQSEEIESFTHIKTWDGYDLSNVNQLQDTVSVRGTRNFGFRMCNISYNEMSDQFSVFDVDFYKDEEFLMPYERRLRLRAKRSGTVHAVMLTWDMWTDREKTRRLSTHPKDSDFPRDMAWGQALQLVEDYDATAGTPQPLVVTEGEELDVVARVSRYASGMQFVVSRVSPS